MDGEGEKRQVQRREADRCPGCVIDQVGTMEDKMEKMAKAVNRLVGSNAVIMVFFCLAMTMLVKSSMNTSEAHVGIEDKYNKMSTRITEVDTTQGYILHHQNLFREDMALFRKEVKHLVKVNSGISTSTDQILKSNKDQLDAYREQNLYLKALIEE